MNQQAQNMIICLKINFYIWVMHKRNVELYSISKLVLNVISSLWFNFSKPLARTHYAWWQWAISASMPQSSDEHNLALITCTLLTDDNTEIDGCPVRIWGFTICTAPVGLIEPNLLSYFIIRESFCYWLLHSFNPVLFLFFRLSCEAETINVSALSISLAKAN